jgi:hypothetical protein
MRVTFEEGTWAAWLYDLMKPHISEVVVCNPRKNGLLKDGSKSDRIDARKLAELLRGNHLKPVVMSVDAGHRYQFCKFLKAHFPDTQFVITTHDRLWAEQMNAAGLVTGKTSISFHSWTIDTGPLVESNVEIWQEIATALGKGKVEAAAMPSVHRTLYVKRVANLFFHHPTLPEWMTASILCLPPRQMPQPGPA